MKEELLDQIFGKETTGSAWLRALQSEREYVRSLDQLALATPRARAPRLTAAQALEAYGLDALLEVALEGSALLADSQDAAGRVLRDRRSALGLEPRHVAAGAGLVEAQVHAAEQSKRLPIRIYEAIARTLGLDERSISVTPVPRGNERLTVRLRVLGDENPALGAATVGALAEAAWVAMTQLRLEAALGVRQKSPSFDPNPSYGHSGYPAFKWGFHLARETRARLGLGRQPIPSLRALVEESLGIPLIQTTLAESVAGVTLETSEGRAIVVNLAGANRNVYVRRSTIAHELGHLLHDPPGRLEALRVDEYPDLDCPPEQLVDRVEQRANAFAVEFIAPQGEAVANYESAQDDPLGRVMDHFGLSFTAARYHVWNGLERRVPLETLQSRPRRPPGHWEASEAFTVDYHPVRGIRPSRAGRFSAVVLRAAQERIISWDTAGDYLEKTADEVRAATDDVLALFPSVFGG